MSVLYFNLVTKYTQKKCHSNCKEEEMTSRLGTVGEGEGVYRCLHFKNETTGKKTLFSRFHTLNSNREARKQMKYTHSFKNMKTKQQHKPWGSTVRSRWERNTEEEPALHVWHWHPNNGPHAENSVSEPEYMEGQREN